MTDYALGYDVALPPATSFAPAPASAAAPGSDWLSHIGDAEAELSKATADEGARTADVVSSSYQAARYTGSVGGNELALGDAIDDRNQSIFQSTGVRLENPVNGGYSAEADARAANSGVAPDPYDTSSAPQEEMQRYRLDAYNQALDQVARDHPHVPGVNASIIAARNALVTHSEELQAHAIAAGGGSLATLPAQFLGGFGASLRDPVQLGLMAVPVGGELRVASTLGLMVKGALHAAAINAGIQAAQEPGLQANRAERGVDNGWVPALKEIGQAGLFGVPIGVAGGAIKALLRYHGAGAHAEGALAGEPAATSALKTAVPLADAPLLHAVVTDHALDRAVMEHRPGDGYPEHAVSEQLAGAVRDAVRFGEGTGPLPDLVASRANPAPAEGVVRKASSLLDAVDQVRSSNALIGSALASGDPHTLAAGRLAQLSDEALASLRAGLVPPEAAQHIPAIFPDPVDHAPAMDALRVEQATTEMGARQVLTNEALVKSHPNAVQQLLEGSERDVPIAEDIEAPAPILSSPAVVRKRSSSPQSLLGFLRAAGGLRDAGGELAARDLHRQYPGLVNNARGVALDRAREMAAEAGFLGGDREAAVSGTTVDDLLKAIDQHPVYAAEDAGRIVDRATRTEKRAYQQRVAGARDDLITFMGKHGLDAGDRELIASAAERMIEHGEAPKQALRRAAGDAYRDDQATFGHEDYPDGFFDGASFSGEDIARAGGEVEGRDAGPSGETQPAIADAGAARGQPEQDEWSHVSDRGSSLLDRVPLGDRQDGGDVHFAHPTDMAAIEAPEAFLARVIEECPF